MHRVTVLATLFMLLVVAFNIRTFGAGQLKIPGGSPTSGHTLREEIRESLLAGRQPTVELSSSEIPAYRNASRGGPLHTIKVHGRDSVAVGWMVEESGYGNGVTTDSIGNVYVVSGSGAYTTAKYGPEGNRWWIAQYTTGEKATDIVVDSSGSVYVTGYGIVGTDYLYVTVKYDHQGAQQWVSHYLAGDLARVLALDPHGGVCITGLAGSDYLTVKYDADGDLLWEARYDRGLSESPFALVVDNSQNVYVTGYAEVPGGSYADYSTIKYGPNGDERWVATYRGPDVGWNAATAIGVDNEASVYVAGYSENNGEYDYASIKYDSLGRQEWTARYDGGGNDLYPVIALGKQGELYVSGSSGYSLSEDYVTTKYDSLGELEWAARYAGQRYGSDLVTAIAVDGDDNVYVTGASEGQGTEYDFSTVKYDADGNPQWIARFGLADHSYDFATDIALDPDGNVLVTGSSIDDGQNISITIKYVQFPSPCAERLVTTLAPADNGIVTSDSVTLLWTGLPSPHSRYWLEVSYDSLFSEPLIDSLLVDTVYTLYSLDHGVSCWWRVRGWASGEWGEFSDTRSFLVFQDTPLHPELESPSNYSVGIPMNTSLRWSQVTGAEFYCVQLSDVVDFSRIVFVEENVNQMSLDVSDLSGNTTYYWRVRGVNTLGPGQWSKVWIFTTEVLSDVRSRRGEMPATLTLDQNYPNPFNPTTRISFGLPERSHVSLVLFDALGRKVGALLNEQKEAGWHDIRLGSLKLASGTYFYRLSVGTTIITRKLLVLR
jgi:hypothetical protein